MRSHLVRPLDVLTDTTLDPGDRYYYTVQAFSYISQLGTAIVRTPLHGLRNALYEVRIEGCLRSTEGKAYSTFARLNAPMRNTEMQGFCEMENF